jgi:SPP1 family predicted phage head-tail adaptor
MTHPSIGSLRHRLTHETSVDTFDDTGGRAEIWTRRADHWAAILSPTGRERATADRLAGTVTHHILVRHCLDIRPSHRFRADTHVYLIHAVLDPVGDRRFLLCRCEQRDL